ncbi:hypothetical protein JDV02_009056 [Purpureocillium takamizusanense]|uniref:2-succinylbenzoate-CoA ligase n=1 Tax=Purpureocillium takamizusanense TaxID=2060973 RepID=A0A9Q8VF29_9HYPO|nr:uncharacterized protein JDV02_009056 [Purpureocillium takamizusanense]UNI23223.1 hypothetical protein JDV02_009056 [Purpureocillium takamizusanense]
MPPPAPLAGALPLPRPLPPSSSLSSIFMILGPSAAAAVVPASAALSRRAASSLATTTFTCSSSGRSSSSSSPPTLLRLASRRSRSRRDVSSTLAACSCARRVPSRMLSTLPRLPIFEAVARHDPRSTAVVHSLSGRAFTYGELLADVSRARDRLHDARPAGAGLDGERVAFLVENSYDYVVTLLACLAARAIAVPLSPAFPAPELQYILDHSEACLLVSSPRFTPKANEVLATGLASPPAHVELPKHLGVGSAAPETVPLDDTDPAGAGLMLYTSGTTNRPKGVLLPQAVLTAQSRSLIEAWNYTPADRLLHVLPLHHIHGTVNALLTPLLAGSSIEFMFPFNADAVWRRLAAPFLPATDGTTPASISSNGTLTNGTSSAAANSHPPTVNGTTASTKSPTTNGATPAPPAPISFFTVVPTVYSRLLASHKHLPPAVQLAARDAVSPAHMRLAISGSAALPTPVKAAWRDLSRGNVLLERYGMTEVGMALSCGLAFADRVDASVGWPLPSVQARLVDVDTGEVIPEGKDVDPLTGRERAGEIQLRGPTVFQEYWRNPDATAKEFVLDSTSDGDDGARPWFKTGDVAVRRPVPSAGHAPDQPWARGPMYFILGRRTADIIKTGGEKVSALEVERELLSLPEVAEAAVVAVPSGNWGQKVGAVIILDGDVVGKWSPLDMRRALKPRLANYKIPQVMKVVDHIPRNAMGKINKKQLVKAIFADETSGDEM